MIPPLVLVVVLVFAKGSEREFEVALSTLSFVRARHSLAREGLLKNDSPRGIWESTDASRQHLADS